MTSEVYTDCPACGDEIPFYETVDTYKECPECGTYWEELFQIAQTPDADVDAEGDAQPAMTDGGVSDE